MIKPVIVNGFDNPDVFKRKKLNELNIVDVDVTDVCYEGYRISGTSGRHILEIVYSIRTVNNDMSIVFPLRTFYSMDDEDACSFDFDEYESEALEGYNLNGLISFRCNKRSVTKCSAIHTFGRRYRFIVKEEDSENLYCLNLNIRDMLVIAYCENQLMKYEKPSRKYTLSSIYRTTFVKDFYYIHDENHPITINGIYGFKPLFSRPFHKNDNNYYIRFSAYSSKEKKPIDFKYGPFNLSKKDIKTLKRKSLNSGSHDIPIILDIKTNLLENEFNLYTSDSDYQIIANDEPIAIRHKSFGDSWAITNVYLAAHDSYRDGYPALYSYLKMGGNNVTMNDVARDMNTEFIKFLES